MGILLEEIRRAFIRLAHANPEIRPIVLPLAKQADKWKTLPDGWDNTSRKKFWESLTGDNKHKVTKCIKEMDGKMDNPGAFCASLADRVEPGWRERTAADDSELRARLIRLAHANPELRGEILPLLSKEASTPEVKIITDMEKAFQTISYQITNVNLGLGRAKTLFRDDPALHKATETFYKELGAISKTLNSERDKFMSAVADAADRGFLKE